MMEKKMKYRVLALSALIAAVFLLFFSRCSPLYPLNNWGEANAFLTVGRGMLAGRVPYRDLALGAGPVVYALHALAACISDTSFLGVWILEIISMTALIYFAWKSALHISGMPRLSLAMAGLMGLLLVSGSAFIYGDTVEEFALPLQMWALCDLLVYLGDPERRMSSCRLCLHGFAAGCVFWLKYELLGVHLAFIAVMCIDDMVRQWELKGALCMCLEFASGAVLATVPWLVYLGVHRAGMEMYTMYIEHNWESLVTNLDPLRNVLAALLSGMKNNPCAALVMLCGAGYLLRRLVHRRWNASCTAMAAAFSSAALIAFAEGERFRFTPMALGAFLMLCAGPIALLLRHAWRRKRAYAALLGCAAALCVGWNCLSNDSLPRIGYPREELPQAALVRYIEENGGGELLAYHFNDTGFYLEAGALPPRGAFTDSDAYGTADIWSKQKKYADAQKADWIISRSMSAPGGYTRVETANSDYDRSTDSEAYRHRYYLYARLDK